MLIKLDPSNHMWKLSAPFEGPLQYLWGEYRSQTDEDIKRFQPEFICSRWCALGHSSVKWSNWQWEIHDWVPEFQAFKMLVYAFICNLPQWVLFQSYDTLLLWIQTMFQNWSTLSHSITLLWSSHVRNDWIHIGSYLK